MARIKYSRTRGLQKIKKRSVSAKIVEENKYQEMRDWTAKEIQRRSNEDADAVRLASKIRITSSNNVGNLHPEIEAAIIQLEQYCDEMHVDPNIADVNILNDVLPSCLVYQTNKPDPVAERIITNSKNNLVTVKIRNVFFNFKRLMLFIGDLLTFEATFTEDKALELIVKVVKLVYRAFLATSIELDKKDADIILMLHRHSSKDRRIDENQFIDIVLKEDCKMDRDEISNRIKKLLDYHCIAIEDGKIYLVEKI